MARTQTSDARIALRLPLAQKSRFEAAAEAAGYSSLSDFVLTTLQTKSAEILDREARLVLSERDYDTLAAAVKEGRGPSKKTLKFFKKYGKDFIPAPKGQRTDDPF